MRRRRPETAKTKPPMVLMNTEVYGQLSVWMQIVLWGGVIVSFPYTLIQLWKFVAPGLYRHEKRAFLPYLVATPVFFLLGATLVALANEKGFTHLPTYSLGYREAAPRFCEMRYVDAMVRRDRAGWGARGRRTSHRPRGEVHRRTRAAGTPLHGEIRVAAWERIVLLVR